MPDPSRLRPIWETPNGDRVPSVSADEMRAVDRIAVEEVGLQLLQMMENAGRGLATIIRDRQPERVIVVAGNGGNGGGGLACARHLANHDVEVSVVLDRQSGELTGAAATQFGILDAMDVPITVASDESTEYATAPLVVDALVGYGLEGALRGTASSIVEDVNTADADVVSLDIPSGLDATTGERPGPAVTPDEVVTLALPKMGLVACACPVRLLDIGIPAVVFDRVGVEYTQPFGETDSIAISYNPDL